MNALPKKSSSASLRPDIPRRAGDKSQQAQAGKTGQQQQGGRAFPESKGKQLIVGREISLTGEIKDCEQLVVEGSVEAALVGSDMLVVLDGGAFTGPAEVREAHINGEFEGELTVSGRLVVMNNGHVSGKVRYGELEVQRGGVISGDLSQLD